MIFFRKEVQMNLYYIYHSCFAVEGKSHIVIFDYYKIPKEKATEREYFFNRYIRQQEKKVYIFSSHRHEDHFNSEILSWSQENKEIQYILSKDIQVSFPKNAKIFCLEEGDKVRIDDINIFTYGSTDAGVSFIVYMEEKIIFHAGDFHLWHWEDDTEEEEETMREEYFRILKTIQKDKHSMIDYAFLPVDPRLGRYTTEGLENFVKELDILQVIPMHFWENYFVMEEAKAILDEYGVQLIAVKQPMEMIHGIFYMLKKEERGYYIDLVDSYGKAVSEEEIELDPIYPYIPMEQKDVFFAGWDKKWDRIFLEAQEELLQFLKEQDHFVKENFEKITWKKGKYSLILCIREKKGEEGIYTSQIELSEVDEDISIITEDIVANGSFYSLKNKRTGLYDLKDFITELRFPEVEKLMTLAHKHFPEMELRYRDYKTVEVETIIVKPQILIEKIASDNSLYLRISAEVSSMDYKFLKDNDFEEVVTLNLREKRIQISKIDTSPVRELVEELVKILVKTQRELGIRQAYYLDEDYFLILPENVAREFITKNLLQFANQYQIAGTDKLKKYNIKAVKPRITGNFHYSIDFLEGEAEIEIEGEKFSIQEVLSSYQKDSYIVLSDGTNALINKRYIEKLERIFKESEDNKVKISFFDLPIVDDIIEEKILSDEYVLQKNFFYGMNCLTEYQVSLPKLNATLRSYQEYGYKWLSYLSEKNLGACLADDMGLGKTLQAIAILTKLHQEKKKSLIIMPKSLIYNWQSEIEKFSPGLKVGIYYGNHRDLQVMEEQDVILTTYGTVRNDIVLLKEFFFDLVILDESQNIKNIHSQTTRAVMLLQSQNRIALSGTPIENNLSELYSLFRFLNPGMFGSLEEFNNTYALPIQKENNPEAVQDLRKKIYPFILRRVKKEVLQDLPDKIEKTIYIDMNVEHKKFYEERRNYYYNMIHASIREKGLGKAQFFILQALNELRQITSCPEVKNSYISSSKKEMLIEQIVEAVENDHKVLVFTNYIGSIENICKSLEEREIAYLSMTGSTKDRQQLVNKFQKNEKYKVFVMTLKTGGVGLNLTAADTIFIYDPWWNKTVENQAIDRAYRLGQDRTVFSYKLILKDTIEEKILQLQELKSKLLDDVISEDNLSNKSFTEKEIEFILGK